MTSRHGHSVARRFVADRLLRPHNTLQVLEWSERSRQRIRVHSQLRSSLSEVSCMLTSHTADVGNLKQMNRSVIGQSLTSHCAYDSP
jgi:hypothetical protein